MRNAIIACLLLSLAVPPPSSAQDLSSDAAKPDVRDRNNSPRPTAGQPRRRAVRKTQPLGPVAKADSYSVQRGGTLVVPATTGVLANDTEPQARPLTAILVSSTTQGTLTLNADGGFTYNNNGSAATSDSFTYKANNGTVDTTAATATITITEPPPLPFNDAYSATQNTTLTVPQPGVLANDTLNNAAIGSYGINGAEQTAIGAGTPTAAGGTIRLNADGSFQYEPGSFTGSDTFKYVLVNSVAAATASVTITVQANNVIDFVVTSPGFFYRFTGVSGDNPVLTLTRGRTYRFQINTSAIHPFEILDAPGGTVTNNNISNGILTFAVPAGAGTYRYHCSFHDFGNNINTTP